MARMPRANYRRDPRVDRSQKSRPLLSQRFFFLRLAGRTKCLLPPVKRKKSHSPVANGLLLSSAITMKWLLKSRGDFCPDQGAMREHSQGSVTEEQR